MGNRRRPEKTHPCRPLPRYHGGISRCPGSGEEQDIRRATGRDYTTDAVQLMTLHGAKGLEFPVVFLAGVNRGTLPLSEPARPRTPKRNAVCFCGNYKGKRITDPHRRRRIIAFSGRTPSSIRVETIKVPTRRKKNPHCFKSIPAYRHIHRINAAFRGVNF